MTLAARIKAARTDAGLSQEKVAEAMNVSRQAVAKWESGQSAPSTANLIRLAALLGTTVDALTGVQEPKPEAVTVSVDKEVYAAALIDAKKQLAAEQRAIRIRNGFFTVLAALCWLLLFLAGRIFCTTGDEPMTVMGWLFSTSPYRATYLFGWLTGHGYYLWCSVLSIAPAWFGNHRFSLLTFGGFALGFVVGELFGAYPAGVPYGQGHYGWAIWGAVFLLSIPAGVLAEILAKKRQKKQHTD